MLDQGQIGGLDVPNENWGLRCLLWALKLQIELLNTLHHLNDCRLQFVVLMEEFHCERAQILAKLFDLVIPSQFDVEIEVIVITDAFLGSTDFFKFIRTALRSPACITADRDLLLAKVDVQATHLHLVLLVS